MSDGIDGDGSYRERTKIRLDQPLSDGDLITLTIQNKGGADYVYYIYIHKYDAQQSPQAIVTVDTAGEDGSKRIKLAAALRNVKVQAGEISVLLKSGTVSLTDEEGIVTDDAVTGITEEEKEILKGYEVSGSGITVGKIAVERQAETIGETVYDRLTVWFDTTEQKNERGKAKEIGESKEVIAEVYLRLNEGYGYQDLEPRAAPGDRVSGLGYLFDARFIDVTLIPTVENNLPTEEYMTITGTVSAYNAREDVRPKILVYRHHPGTGVSGAAITTVSAMPAASDAGFGRQTFDFAAPSLIAGECYDLVVTKTGHTRVTVKGICSQSDLTITTLLTLYCGDVDGDGHVGVFDKDLLMMHYSGTSTGSLAEDVKPLFDLDGDGFVGIFDVDLLTDSDNYGKQDTTLIWNEGANTEDRKE